MLKMLTFLEYIAKKPVTKAELNALEKTMDRLFGALSMDIEFTRHFLDRINDPRNKEQITIDELETLFRKEFAVNGQKIVKMNPDAEGVLKDMETDINVPFALHINMGTGLLELRSKTIMRKKNFKTSDRSFNV